MHWLVRRDPSDEHASICNLVANSGRHETDLHSKGHWYKMKDK